MAKTHQDLFIDENEIKKLIITTSLIATQGGSIGFAGLGSPGLISTEKIGTISTHP